MVVHDVSRRRYGHKINLNVRVGIHSGKVACGVLGFTGGTHTRSDFGSRWHYEVWGNDVLVASEIENNGRPGWVHVTHTTAHQITKKRNATTGITEPNNAPPNVVFRKRTANHGSYSSNNENNYTFERGHGHAKFDTYFVVPSTMVSYIYLDTLSLNKIYRFHNKSN